MNNKIFRIILMFLAVCISSISTLFAVSFGLSNVTLDHDNQDLTQENEKLNDAVSDLQNTINMDPASAVVSYEVDGKIWKIDVTKKGNSVSLPTAPDTDTHAFDGWKIDGEGEKMTDNTTIKENTKFVANMVEKDWLTVASWGGLCENLDGKYVWTDGENTYYSNYSEQYVFGEDETWEKITWIGLTSFEGRYIWTDGENTYHSNGSSHYVLKDDNTWEKTTWNGLTSFDCRYIWTDGSNTYYSEGSNQYVLGADNTWETVTWTGLSNFYGQYIWTDGEKIYYSYSSDQYILGADNTWETVTWTGLTSFSGEYTWTDGNDIYYCSNNDNYILDKANKEWSNIQFEYNQKRIPAWGANIWTHNGKQYFYYNNMHFTFDKTIKNWVPAVLKGLKGDFRANNNIWTDGINTYYSESGKHFVLASNTRTWEPITWQGLSGNAIEFSGRYIWTDGVETYLEYFGSYKLNKATKTWEAVERNKTISTDSLWTDGVDVYCDNYKFNRETKEWEDVEWQGDVKPRYSDKYYRWSDGVNTYYSDGSNHYILKENYTWEVVQWNLNINGRYIWTDGTNTYYSNYNQHYVLDQITNTWLDKKWVTSDSGFYAEHIWTDGENIYMSDGSDQYILNRNKNA